MQSPEIFQLIFNRSATALDNKSYLKKVMAQYPYFGLAHFYTLKNTAFHETDFNATAAKTNLFFNNTFQLNKLIQQQHIPEKTTSLLAKQQQAEPLPVSKEVLIEFMEPEKKQVTELSAPIKEPLLSVEHEPISATSPSQTVSDEAIVEQIEALKKRIVQQDDQMLFEPLHASDYFASQGIKLSEAQLADDKLGKQLKSFTSWLKTMKKVHPDKLPPTNVIVEKAIQTQAEKSNVEEDIYTEAMAEAYLLQGKENKAIEIYSKLSLMIPSKSTYFATKIDSLKK